MVQSSLEKNKKFHANIVDSKKLSFAHSFKPIYCFSRIFGFMPFSIVHDRNGKIQTARVTVLDFLWFLISNGIYLMSAFHHVIFNQQSPIVDTSIVLVNCTRSLTLIRKLFDCLCIAMDMCNRFKIVEILKKINTFDDKVRDRDHVFAYSVIFLRFFISHT